VDPQNIKIEIPVSVSVGLEKSGWLFKKGPKSISKWKKRWFVAQKNSLSYYLNYQVPEFFALHLHFHCTKRMSTHTRIQIAQERIPLGEVDLKGGVAITKTPLSMTYSNRFMFDIITKDRHWHFYTLTQNEQVSRNTVSIFFFFLFGSSSFDNFSRKAGFLSWRNSWHRFPPLISHYPFLLSQQQSQQQYNQ
jgi:hypothetical protein